MCRLSFAKQLTEMPSPYRSSWLSLFSPQKQDDVRLCRTLWQTYELSRNEPVWGKSYVSFDYLTRGRASGHILAQQPQGASEMAARFVAAGSLGIAARWIASVTVGQFRFRSIRTPRRKVKRSWLLALPRRHADSERRTTTFLRGADVSAWGDQPDRRRRHGGTFS